MTITQERLASLRKMARSDGLSPPTAAELLDACEALLEEVATLKRIRRCLDCGKEVTDGDFDLCGPCELANPELTPEEPT
jgi:hypothetical protein